MGIKMGVARDRDGQEWKAETYTKGKGSEPLRCLHCAAHVTHQCAHTRERDDKSILIPAYFRLLPGHRHAKGCKHAVAEELTEIARVSDDLLESVQEGRYRLRLVMIKNAFSGGTEDRKDGNGEAGGGVGKNYVRGRGKLPAYINSASRVLVLRAMCDADDEIAEHLELIFEADRHIPWPMFYFEAERYLDAYRAMVAGQIDYPIAIHGTINTIKRVEGKYGPTNVINLSKPKYAPDPSNKSNGIGVDVSIWTKRDSHIANLNAGDEVVVLGLWRTTPEKQSACKDPEKYRYHSFTTYNMTLTLSIRAQIAIVRKAKAT